ncbi:MAG: cytidylyltransferase domain-containing protein [Candidatus Hermodarchaeota archaeon]
MSQARYDSTRLPGKVLKNILNKPLLWYHIKRLEEVKTPNKIIIATTTSDSNKPIVDLAKNMNIDYFIGSEIDVLDRYYQAAKNFNGDIIVRVTSDCPLTEPSLIDEGLKIFLNGDYDYVSNGHPPTFPDGYDIEIFSFQALKSSWSEAKLPSEREHVTPYIWKHTEEFSLFNIENNVDLSSFRLTVDTPEDFILISKIIEEFHINWTEIRLKDVMNYLRKNPDLLKINAQYQYNEGYLKSLEKDKKFLEGKLI